MMKNITAVIPVRQGSVRVKNKNLKPFANSNLLEIKINQLKNINMIDRIIVSSDCEKMLNIANNLGVQTHRREDYYASSEANNSEFFKNLGQSVDGEYLMYSPVTCPMISKETYLDCINTFQKDGIENLVSVSPVKHHMWLDGNPLNYNIRNSPNSQDLPDIYQITYGVSIISKNDMIEYGNVVTENPTFKVLDEIESVDIDTEFDFMVAEFIYNKINNL
jgi:CMP-N-acetylneuraminic acid synthetase